MKIIAHRGNLYGPDKQKENTLLAVEECISKGYDVEIDIWYKNSKLFLGHDFPKILISIDFLNKFKNNLWLHAKNIEVIDELISTDYNWFWHETDKLTLTSKGIPWCYPGNYLKSGITVELEYKKEISEVYGICTDYPLKWI